MVSNLKIPKWLRTVALLAFFSSPLSASELTLKDALELTIKNNPQVLSLLSDYRSFVAQTKFTRGLYDWSAHIGFNYADEEQARVVVFQPSRIKKTTYQGGVGKAYPSGTRLDFFSSILKTQDDSTFNILNSRYQSNLGISIGQELLQDFIHLPLSAKIQSDKIKIEALQHSIWFQIELLIADISRLYWELWGDVELYQVSLQTEKEARDFYGETKRLSKTGLREKDEVFQVETSLLERRQETLLAKTRRENNWSLLKIRLGLTGPHWDSIPQLEDPQWEVDRGTGALLVEALRNRGDYLSSEMNLRANQKLSRSLESNLLPRLTAQGGYSLVGLDPELRTAIDQIEKSKIKGWNIGLVLQHSFGQNIDRSEYEQAEAQVLRSKSLLKERSEDIEHELLRTFRNFKANQSLLDWANQIESKRDFIAKSFKRKYGFGRISIQDLIRSHDDLHQARFRRRIAESQLAITQINLRLAQGTLMTSNGFTDRNPLKLLRKQVQ